MNKFLLFLEKYLAALLVKILGLTWKYRIRTEKPERKVIYAFWHRNLLPLMYLHKREKIVIMVSSSKDGELIAGPARLFGYKAVRGSSSRKGTSATREMLKLARENSLAITPDGPKGPSQKIKDGVLFLAYFTKLPIIPVAVDVSREVVFNSWDRFRFPKLFSKIDVSYGKPIFINSKDEIKTKREFVQRELEKIHTQNLKQKNN